MYFRFSKIAAVFCLVLFFLHAPFSAGQDVPATTAAESGDDADFADPFRVKVDVREVRLDVVVLDWRGRPITDLTAEDFEVYQNNQPQPVTSSAYVDLTEPAMEPVTSRKDSPYFPKVAAATLKEEEVGRTILFVVDNFSSGFEGLRRAQMSINRFLERQMQPNDLVGIMHTGPGNSVLNVFTSDKRHLSARAEAISVFGPDDIIVPAQSDDILAGISFSASSSDATRHRIYSSQLVTLSYSIRAMKDMPGRKIVLFMTAMPTLAIPRPGSMGTDFNAIYGPRFKLLADEALTSGVVVHTMDIKGLDASATYANVPWYGLNPLPVRTGGLFVENSNFFVDGIDSYVNNTISGYYLISYIPPPGTFNLDKDGKEVYHPVQVRVRGRYASVYTRHGFYGRRESETASDTKTTHPLQKALFSPFIHAEINVSIAAGYVKDKERMVHVHGLRQDRTLYYLVRSWIHIDPQDVKIVETEDGGARIVLKTIFVTTDERGVIHDAQLEEYTYTYNINAENKAETIAWLQKHGIRFSMLLPVTKPGFYTIRLGLQDMESGRLGSAYQLVEIPDLNKKAMALSSVFMIVSDEDLAWMNADATKQHAERLFFPTISKADVPTPALRTYKPGDELRTLTMLYNVDARSAARNEIEVQTVLYKDGREYLRGEPRLITSDEAKNPDGIQILQKLTLDGNVPPGNYVLQVLAIDKATRAKEDKKPGILTRILRGYIGDTFTDYNEKAKGIAYETLSFMVSE